MRNNPKLVSAIYDGWHTYQELLIATLASLDEAQLTLRAAPELRSVSEIARHIIGARARWFHNLMGEGGEAFEALGTWDRRGEPARTAEELINGLERTWQGMQTAIDGWTAADWQATWPGEGEDASEPELITREWVIWHLLEHDLHHGGEISLTLGIHGMAGVHWALV